MAGKKTSGSKASKKLDAFNRSQQIHNVLEKGIIESEALLNSAADRPEDDAHIVDLLASTNGESAVRLNSKNRKGASPKRSKRPRSSASKKSKGRKR